jgi:hypothetical protein
VSREWRGNGGIPDRLTMSIDGLEENDAQFLAREAVGLATRLGPKMSGHGMAGLTPVWGDGFFGVRWADDYVWYQEAGIRPFTMRSLAGKTIPMWIDDPTGKVRRENPRADTRVTASGKTQVKIFRKVAPIGSQKTVRRPGPNGTEVVTQVPRSYPGAPGRVAVREARRPWTTQGRVAGAIARGNVGVRWRHPGLLRRSFIRQGIVATADYHGFPVGPVRDSNGRFR